MTSSRITRLTCVGMLAGAATFGLAVSGQGRRAPAFIKVIANGVQRVPELIGCLGPLSPAFPAYSVAEPFAAVNPRNPDNIVAAWMIQNATRRYVVQAAASFDRGRSWSLPRVLPLTTCAGVGRPSLDVATDPWVAFGGDGVAYVSAQTYQGLAGDHAGIQQISVIASRDGGRTWTAAHQTMTFQGPAVKTDNTAVTADPIAPGVAYVLTTRITEPSAAKGLNADRSGAKAIGTAALSQTVDGGARWSAARMISRDAPGEYADLPQLLIDSGRKVIHVVHSRPADHGDIFIQTSDDGGKTWRPAKRVSSFIGVKQKPLHPGSGEPIPVADDIVRAAIEPRSGAIAIAFVDARRTDGKLAQVSLTVSRDAGATWTEPLLVSDAGTPAWLPSLTWLSPDVLSISYLDGRSARDGPSGEINLWVVRVKAGRPQSIDDVRLVERFPLLPQRAESPYFLADYYPMLALDSEVGLVYIRNRCESDAAPCVAGQKADRTRGRSEVVFARLTP
jgi:BNR/Asp-box repeat protein